MIKGAALASESVSLSPNLLPPSSLAIPFLSSLAIPFRSSPPHPPPFPSPFTPLLPTFLPCHSLSILSFHSSTPHPPPLPSPFTPLSPPSCLAILFHSSLPHCPPLPSPFTPPLPTLLPCHPLSLLSSPPSSLHSSPLHGHPPPLPSIWLLLQVMLSLNAATIRHVQAHLLAAQHESQPRGAGACDVLATPSDDMFTLVWGQLFVAGMADAAEWLWYGAECVVGENSTRECSSPHLCELCTLLRRFDAANCVMAQWRWARSGDEQAASQGRRPWGGFLAVSMLLDMQRFGLALLLLTLREGHGAAAAGLGARPDCCRQRASCDDYGESCGRVWGQVFLRTFPFLNSHPKA